MRKPNINGTQLVVGGLGPVSRKRKIPGQSSAQPKSGVASDPPPNVGGTVASATLRRTPATKFLPVFVVAAGQGLCVHPMPHPETHRAGGRSTPTPSQCPGVPTSVPPGPYPGRRPACRPVRDQPQREGVHPPTPLVLQHTSCGRATSGHPAALHPCAHTPAPAHPCAECCIPTTASRTGGGNVAFDTKLRPDETSTNPAW